MATRRKRTNKNVPAKGRLRDFADDLWKLAVRDDWGYKCAACGNVGSPWQINLWTRDLDTVKEDVIPGGCKCGGTVILIDD